jgi:hypothetical protein
MPVLSGACLSFPALPFRRFPALPFRRLSFPALAGSGAIALATAAQAGLVILDAEQLDRIERVRSFPSLTVSLASGTGWYCHR